VRVSAKVDYAVRAVVELAAAPPDTMVKADAIADAQDVPRKFLDTILQGLRQAGIVDSRRGPEGGHRLARPAEDITIASIIRAIDGPLANVGGRPPEEVVFPGSAEALRDVWVAARASLRSVLEEVSVADVVQRRLPARVGELTAHPDAWDRPWRR
jgi:Rrf2 family protein